MFLLLIFLWILLLIYQYLSVGLTLFLPLLIGFLGLLGLYLAIARLLLHSVLNYSLKTVFAYMACQLRSLATVTLSSRVSSGNPFVSCSSVGWLCLQLIILKLMA